jgi:hypothetical protein
VDEIVGLDRPRDVGNAVQRDIKVWIAGLPATAALHGIGEFRLEEPAQAQARCTCCWTPGNTRRPARRGS